jgi:hypothetical protein
MAIFVGDGEEVASEESFAFAGFGKGRFAGVGAAILGNFIMESRTGGLG